MKKSLLNLLDRRFEGCLRAADVQTLFPKGSEAIVNALFDRGILLRGRFKADSVACPHGLHDGSGLIDAEQKPDGSYHGLCAEHGQLVTVPAHQAEWIEFGAAAWVEAVRSANGLVGDARLLQNGLYILGTLQREHKKMAVAAVSAHALADLADADLNSFGTQTVIYVDLGNRAEASQRSNPRFVVVNANDILDENLFSFQKAPLSRLLADVSAGSAATGFPFEKYAAGYKNAVPLSEEEYERETAPKSVKRFSLFIDLAKLAAWRDGKQVLHMAGGKSSRRKGKPISKTGLKLIAHFLKRPHVPTLPHRAEPYAGADADSRDPKSAQVMFVNMRKALRLDEVLKTRDNSVGDPGNCTYSFEPSSKFTYVLIAPAPQITA